MPCGKVKKSLVAGTPRYSIDWRFFMEIPPDVGFCYCCPPYVVLGSWEIIARLFLPDKVMEVGNY